MLLLLSSSALISIQCEGPPRYLAPSAASRTLRLLLVLLLLHRRRRRRRLRCLELLSASVNLSTKIIMNLDREIRETRKRLAVRLFEN